MIGHLDCVQFFFFFFFPVMSNAAVNLLGHFNEDFCRIILRSRVFRAKEVNIFSCGRYC